MKFLVVGAGGIGGYFGARLAADGNDVTFQVRGRQAAAMAAEGLKVLSPLGDVHIEAPQLLSETPNPGHFDAVLLCTKLWGLAAAAEELRPLLAHDSLVAPLQNGVEAEEIVAGVLGREHVIGAVAQIAAQIEEPGVIRHRGKMARFAFGELDGSRSWRLDALEAACSSAGIDVRLSDKIEKNIWQKFILLTALAGATAYRRQTLGEVLADPAGRAFHAALVGETAAVAQAKGAPVSEDIAAKVVAAMDHFPADAKSSMLVDLELGNRLELHWLNGAVVRLGQALGVETPHHAEVVAALTPYAEGKA
jgi:2-dehydropantoate 2-reductase